VYGELLNSARIRYFARVLSGSDNARYPHPSETPPFIRNLFYYQFAMYTRLRGTSAHGFRIAPWQSQFPIEISKGGDSQERSDRGPAVWDFATWECRQQQSSRHCRLYKWDSGNKRERDPHCGSENLLQMFF
jgi:hypothetical protein